MKGIQVYVKVLILVLAASSLVLCSTVSAQSNSVLAAPQFTVTYVDKSYDVEPIYGIDQYTGQTVVKTKGYHVQNASVVVKIKNQPFSSYDVNNSQVDLFYKISVKGHYGNYWQEYTHYFVQSGEYSTEVYYRSVDNEEYTVAMFGFTSNNGSSSFNGHNLDVDAGEVDFRVQAYSAYFTREKVSMVIPGWREYNYVINIVSTSGWSDTQTLTIGSGEVTVTETPTPSPTTSAPIITAEPTFNPTATPTQGNTQTGIALPLSLEQVVLLVMAVVIVALAAALVVSRKRRT